MRKNTRHAVRGATFATALVAALEAQPAVQQCRTDQVRRALAHHALDVGAGDAGAAQITEGGIEGDIEVAQGVDHRAIQVNDDGPDVCGHASAARIWSITAL